MAAPDFVAPAYCWVPEHTSTVADEGIDLAMAAGIPLDPEQRMALEVLLAEKHGRWASFEKAIVAPRQNIKTHIFKAVALIEAFLLETDLVVWSAHEFNTTMESMRELLEIIEENEFLDRRVKKVDQANGKEGIELVGRQRIRFKARTKTGARGLSAPTLLLDEAFALKPAHIGSLMPTMSARSVTGNPHIIYGSSAGHLDSAVLRSLRDRGRAGGDPSLTWIEWCDDAPRDGCELEGCSHAYGTPGCILDDEERWRRANLATDRRISIEFLRTERRSMDPMEFAREIMGWFDEPADGIAGAPLERWKACANRKAELADPPVLGLDVDHGQMSASIVASGGALHVARHRDGTAWIIDELVGMLGAHPGGLVAVDGTSGPVRALIPTLEKSVDDGGAGLTIRSKANPNGNLIVLDGPEVVDACETILRDILEGKLVHRDEHDLNAAVEGAGRRQVGDSWRWSRRDSKVAISPLTAATWANWVGQQTTAPIDVADSIG